MRVRLQDLPPDAAFQLARLVREGGQSGTVLFHANRRLWLAVMGFLSLAIGLLSGWSLRSGEPCSPRLLDAILPWVGLLGLVYGPLALVEYLRVQGADLKPFLLLTPMHLLRCHGSHRPLEVYRLSEASAFLRVEEYDGAKWKGQAFKFEFDGGHKVAFTLHQLPEVEAANRVLDLARAVAGGDRPPAGLPLGGLPMTQLPSLPGDRNFRQFLDPASELWLLVLGLLCIGLVVWVLLRMFIH